MLAMAGAIFASLGGCVSLSKDAGFGDVQQDAAGRLDKRVAWARNDAERAELTKAVAALLEKPLTLDDAVQVALLNNRGLQAMYAELGIAEADLVQAGRLPNPRFSTIRVRSDTNFKYETSLTFPILGLVTMPAALKMERRRFEAVKLEVSDRILDLAARTREAYVNAVAADETVRYLEQVNEAAEVGAELSRRMAAVGNSTRLDHMRERAFHAETTAQLARARAAAVSAHERLARLLGLPDGPGAFRLPERLPDLPPQATEVVELEAFALSHRLDVEAARRDAASVAASLGLVKATRVVNALELGPATLMEGGEPFRKGYEISVEVPLFDWGGSKVARAEAIYLQAVDRVAQTAVAARSEVRESYEAYRAAWEIARSYRDEIVPLRRQISEEHLLRYNGMLIGVFELLADAREQVAAAHGYIEALRDYWLAEADLLRALGGRLPVAAAAAAGQPRTTPSTPPSAPGQIPAHVHEHSKG